jgi:hypothetical protein
MSCNKPIWKTYTGLTGLHPFEYCDACGMKKEDHPVKDEIELTCSETIYFFGGEPFDSYQYLGHIPPPPPSSPSEAEMAEYLEMLNGLN